LDIWLVGIELEEVAVEVETFPNHTTRIGALLMGNQDLRLILVQTIP
jgi:hypothetical protein